MNTPPYGSLPDQRPRRRRWLRWKAEPVSLANDPDHARRIRADEENREKFPSRKQRLKAKNRRR